MTTHDIYAWVQMGLQILIGGGVVAGIYRYYGVLKRAIESQERTIAAQAEHMKAQSTVLQDFERLNQLMQRVIDTVSDPAALQREQAYKARVDRDAAKTLQQSITKAQEQLTKSYLPTMIGLIVLVTSMLPFLDLKRRRTLIEASGLPLPLQEQFLEDKGLATDEQSLEQYRRDPLNGPLTDVPPPQNVPGEPQ
jgi:hypothetical protein